VTQGSDINQAVITASAANSAQTGLFGYVVTSQILNNSTISVGGSPHTTNVTFSLNAAAPSQGLVLPVSVVDTNFNPSNFVTVPSSVTVPGGATSFLTTATAAQPGTGYVLISILGSIQLITVVP
jgi:hypothetical protein